LRSVIDNHRGKYRIGSNASFVEKLNYLSRRDHLPWKVTDITVWEGGLVDGRIEVTGFEFSNGVMVEEVNLGN
jgi:hypothetical protein